jgi:glycosyltransferase involved in cell wall biosynthesis
MTVPDVSIIVPYYNSKAYLERLIQSVMRQEHTGFECILVDDGSKDNSFDIAAALTQDDARFKNVKRPEGYLPGGRGAKNYGLSLSKAAYIMFFDSDDVMLPRHISSRLEFLQQNPGKDAVVSDFGWRVMEGRQKKIYRYNPSIFEGFRQNVTEDWFWLNYMDLRFWFNPGNPMWRRSSISDKPLWDETTSIGEDHEYHARLMLQGLDFGHLKSVTWDYMANSDSMISTSEAIKPLLSRSYGKMLVNRNILKYQGFRPSLVRKELTWQMKILRRIVACQGDTRERTEAIATMKGRISDTLKMLGYGSARRSVIMSALHIVVFLHKGTGKFFQAYEMIIPDREPTMESKYFTIS